MTGLPYRSIPSVDRVLADSALVEVLAESRRDIVVEAVRERLALARLAIGRGEPAPSASEVAEAAAGRLRAAWASWPSPVLNATGVILHTNLGRAPLSEESLRAVSAAARGYADLEFDLADGKRGSRYSAIAGLLRQLMGAEDALVVNNNAGAMLLGLASLAAGREVVVSRGEASEIGGGFRIPDVLAQSGASLVEVGTVNRTYAGDYERALTDGVAAILVVHRSNFQVIGFTHEPALSEVATVGAAHGVPVLHDLGSGALIDTAGFGLGHEPTPQESLAAGAGLVFFSGDKLLGGPQAGLVVGNSELIAKLRGHPLARALRADKLTLAALHATLLHYVRGEARERIPVWRMVGASREELDIRASALARAVGPGAAVVDALSAIGGGSRPTEGLPSRAVRIDSSGGVGVEELARRLRSGSPAVVGRIEGDCLLLDLRTVPAGRDGELMRAVAAARAGGSRGSG